MHGIKDSWEIFNGNLAGSTKKLQLTHDGIFQQDTDLNPHKNGLLTTESSCHKNSVVWAEIKDPGRSGEIYKES